ncbi:AbrB family transcriptional regulator [Limnofasciculus baicalensis]|uniref:AbrB family transcriptional regulator n=1 Tax=Limnofasciculus baicalensis BBK-W-15 TaxID=2699891 RepID=A0AAE3GMS6_9CYAN|nr:AbrB family transcriptional regulator [Limnofasciculus baicalensis]MCP2727264.1 AbrB family transcriptional regulator [Limnofasciculus baicalensis BBK-W-15]
MGNWVGRKLNLPLSVFLGPFIVGLIAVWLLPYPLKMPPSIFSVGLLFVGVSIGLKFDWKTVYKLRKAVLIEIVLVMVLILVCLGVGYEFHILTQVDSLTAVLGSTPGAISAIIASAIQLGGDSGLVLTMQMSRMLVILLITPWMASFFKKSTQ